ncbi:hypothetical protein LTR50_006142 [Elasticomyces elasticus]|nr:hypothetical protein LTR50_006142 [Elasticomyces elasticus]
MSDLSMLLDMGFEKEKAGMGLKKGGNLTGAIDWLEKNAEKSIEDLKADEAADIEVNGPALQPGEEARSLVCNDCGKKFRSTAQAEYHASKTEHTNFAESTEEVKPLTEEEKAAKLAELRQKAAERKAGQSDQDKLERKRNEQIRMKSTKEQSDAKEALKAKQQIQEAADKRRWKVEELEVKKKIQQKIAADKEARKLKAEQEKAARAAGLPEGTILTGSSAPAPAPAPAAAAAPRAAPMHSEARLRLQTPSGNIMKTFSADTTLFEVAQAIGTENGTQVSSFTQNFPRKVFDGSDFGLTLKEAGLVPSAALIVQ